MLNHGMERGWPTVSQVAYAVVCLIVLKCTGGLLKHYPVITDMIDIGRWCIKHLTSIHFSD